MHNLDDKHRPGLDSNPAPLSFEPLPDRMSQIQHIYLGDG